MIARRKDLQSATMCHWWLWYRKVRMAVVVDVVEGVVVEVVSNAIVG